ncbi:MAG: 4Fe-4S binding protein [Spirochaetia bacterium]|nr:4Fe-4S binding protein [Spirochaetia bacterium]
MKTEQQPLIEVVEDKCVNCHRCISVCPVKMCNNGSGDHVEVNHDLCMGASGFSAPQGYNGISRGKYIS